MKRTTKLLTVLATTVSTVAFAGAGWAYWATNGSGSATASVGNLGAPTGVTVPATSSGTVAVSWTASSPVSPNVTPQGYYVERSSNATTWSAACVSSPAVFKTSPCNDTVGDGTYKYRVTAVYKSWTAQSTLSGAVTVSTLALTSVSPASRGRGAVNQDVTITGTGFVNGSGLAVTFSGTGITVNSTTFLSATQVKANITIAPTATTGARDVTVTNPDGGTATKTGGFTVNASPTITSPTAASTVKIRKQTAATVTVSGTGFQPGATFVISGTFSGSGTVTFVSSTQISVSATAPNGNNQKGSITVTNPDGGTATSADSLESTS